jgi:hypothetical protein
MGIKEKAIDFLKKLSDETDGDTSITLEKEDLYKKIGYIEDYKVMDYLLEKKWIINEPRCVGITVEGVLVAEKEEGKGINLKPKYKVDEKGETKH